MLGPWSLFHPFMETNIYSFNSYRLDGVIDMNTYLLLTICQKKKMLTSHM